MEQTGTEKRLNTLLSAAARVSRDIASILDLPILLNRTVDAICDEFGFYYAGIFLMDDSGQNAVLRSGRGDAGRAMLEEEHHLMVGGNSMVGTVIQKRTGHISLDVETETAHFKNPHLPKTHSEMALPLIAGDDLIGALTVQSEQEAAFTESETVCQNRRIDGFTGKDSKQNRPQDASDPMDAPDIQRVVPLQLVLHRNRKVTDNT